MAFRYVFMNCFHAGVAMYMPNHSERYTPLMVLLSKVLLSGSCASPTATNADTTFGTKPAVSMYVFSFVPVLAKVLRPLSSWVVAASPPAVTTPWLSTYAMVCAISGSMA